MKQQQKCSAIITYNTKQFHLSWPTTRCNLNLIAKYVSVVPVITVKITIWISQNNSL